MMIACMRAYKNMGEIIPFNHGDSGALQDRIIIRISMLSSSRLFDERTNTYAHVTLGRSSINVAIHKILTLHFHR